MAIDPGTLPMTGMRRAGPRADRGAGGVLKILQVFELFDEYSGCAPSPAAMILIHAATVLDRHRALKRSVSMRRRVIASAPRPHAEAAGYIPCSRLGGMVP
jgi:hypothetical protein